MPEPDAVVIENLVKRFGDFIAVDNVSLNRLATWGTCFCTGDYLFLYALDRHEKDK